MNKVRVPEGFRESMGRAGALSYRVLYFEKEGDRFKRPDEYQQHPAILPPRREPPAHRSHTRAVRVVA